MYTVTKFVLDNGQEFNSEKEARKALDRLYSNALEKLVHGLWNCNGKYSEMLNYLDNNVFMMQDIVDFYREKSSMVDV